MSINRGVAYEVELALTESAEQSAQQDHEIAQEEPHQAQEQQRQQQAAIAAAAAAAEEDDEFEPQNLIYSLFRLGFLFALLAQNGSATRVAILSVLAFLIVLNQLGVYRWDSIMEWIYRRPAAPAQEPQANPQDQREQQQQPEAEPLLQGQPQLNEEPIQPKEGFWTTFSHVCLSFLSSAFPAPPHHQQQHQPPPVDAGVQH